MKTALAQFLLVLWLVNAAHAQTTLKLLPFQGRLTDQNGVAVSNGVRLVQFKIYDVPTGGNPVWAGELHRTTVNGGLVNVMLGSKTPLTFDFDRQLYLEITVDVSGQAGQPDNAITAADPPMLPRQAILPVVFAKEAADSRKLAGYDWSPIFGTNSPNGPIPASKLADGSLPGSKIQAGSITSNQIASATITGTQIAPTTITSNQIANGAVGSSKIEDGAIQDRHIGVLSHLTASGSPSNSVVVDATGRVGIGVNNPQAKLDIAGTLQFAAMAEQSLGSNGYVQIGELIIQWGQEAAAHDINGNTTTLTFPRSFPNQVFVVVPGILTTPGFSRGVAICVESFNQSTVTVHWDEWANLTQSVRASYIAIGR